MIDINEKRLEFRLGALAEFGTDPKGGWSRFSYTKAHKEAQQLLKSWMEEIGMKVRVDAIGNMIGRLEGQNPDLPVVATGSHIDTVKCGGKYDGNLGVLAGLEALTSIAESGIQRRSPMELIIFIEEEGTRFGKSLFGSQAMTGKIQSKDLKGLIDDTGSSAWDVLLESGFDPAKINSCISTKGYYKCYFELHIEQGAVLETANKVMGVVKGISGPRWFKTILKGRADHAGATPMHLRRDPLIPAAKIIQKVEEITNDSPSNDVVGTVGKIAVSPCNVNIIPGQVEMTFDIRDIDVKQRDQVVERIKEYILCVCEERGIKATIEDMNNVQPAIVPEKLIALLEGIATKLEVPHMKMISGAGHDAQLMADITDMAMIFTPSISGLSHCPEEDTKTEDIMQCTRVLTQALVEML